MQNIRNTQFSNYFLPFNKMLVVVFINIKRNYIEGNFFRSTSMLKFLQYNIIEFSKDFRQNEIPQALRIYSNKEIV